MSKQNLSRIMPHYNQYQLGIVFKCPLYVIGIMINRRIWVVYIHTRWSSLILCINQCILLQTKKTLLNTRAFRAQVRNSVFAAFIDGFTSNTYVMVEMSDPRIPSEATLINIRNARKHFEKLEKVSSTQPAHYQWSPPARRRKPPAPLRVPPASRGRRDAPSAWCLVSCNSSVDVSKDARAC